MRGWALPRWSIARWAPLHGEPSGLGTGHLWTKVHLALLQEPKFQRMQNCLAAPLMVTSLCQESSQASRAPEGREQERRVAGDAGSAYVRRVETSASAGWPPLPLPTALAAFAVCSSKTFF